MWLKLVGNEDCECQLTVLELSCGVQLCTPKTRFRIRNFDLGRQFALLDTMDDEENDIKTRLMTLLNVSHLKYGLRPIDENSTGGDGEPPAKRPKLNSRAKRSSEPVAPVVEKESESGEALTQKGKDEALNAPDEQDGNRRHPRTILTLVLCSSVLFPESPLEYDDQRDPFWTHFGPAPLQLTELARQNADASTWTTSTTRNAALGGASLVNLSLPSSSSASSSSTLPTSKLVSRSGVTIAGPL